VDALDIAARVWVKLLLTKEKTMKTHGVALLGCGRMGIEHAKTLLGIANAQVVAVADPFLEARERAKHLTKAKLEFANPEDAIHAPGVDAVLIVTPTPTHAPLIESAAKAGKAIFCEKPVALDLQRTKAALAVVEAAGVPFQIGFNRRFDPPFAAAKHKIQNGELGEIRQFRAVGRDPAPPSLEYLAASGGQFIDQAIHDLDIARFLVGEVEEVLVWGTAHNPEIAALGDSDTITTLLRFVGGAIGVIENSRTSSYGYDVTTEIFGTGGKLVLDATPKTPLWQYGQNPSGQGVLSADHYHFFMDRFVAAYKLELEAFFASLEQGSLPAPSAFDALESLRLGLAATRSYREKRAVRLSEV
jgi:myo-inositol 2-dehydrogenase / D-chiro-inositol 1-dehydrogenase